MAIREPHVSIGHRHQPLKSSQLPIPLRHVAIRWRHQPINCPHRTIRFRHLSREWLHSGLKISTVTAGDSRPRFCLSTAPAAHVPGQPHISLRSFRLDAANRTLHKADEDTDLLQPSKRRRASLHRRRKRSRRSDRDDQKDRVEGAAAQRAMRLTRLRGNRDVSRFGGWRVLVARPDVATTVALVVIDERAFAASRQVMPRFGALGAGAAWSH